MKAMSTREKRGRKYVQYGQIKSRRELRKVGTGEVPTPGEGKRLVTFMTFDRRSVMAVQPLRGVGVLYGLLYDACRARKTGKIALKLG
jgi:hypothetical protein